MEILSFALGLAVTGAMLAGLIYVFVVLPMRGARAVTHRAKTMVLGEGYNLSPADRLRLQRDQLGHDYAHQIANAEAAARYEAEAARQAALQRAQGIQQTTQKWV